MGDTRADREPIHETGLRACCLEMIRHDQARRPDFTPDADAELICPTCGAIVTFDGTTWAWLLARPE